MNIAELNDKINKLNNNWENFKSVNDQKLKDTQKGKCDPLYDVQLDKINQDLDKNRDRIAHLEVLVARPDKNYNINNSKEELYTKAFTNYIRKGIEDNLGSFEKKALSSPTDNEGGYLVTSSISRQLSNSIVEISPMRQLADIETISSDSLDIIEDYETLDSGWTSEKEPIKETYTPKIHKKKIQVHELYAQPKATQKLIDDANIDIEKWLGQKLLHSFAEKENRAFIKGDGEGKPRGILSYKNGKHWNEIEQIESKSAGEITAESIFNLYFSLKEQYSSRAAFLMHKTTIQKIRMLKDKNNQYLWAPGLDKSIPSTLLGLPVKYAVDMPSAEEKGLVIALADFKLAYKIVDRINIRTLRDPFTEKPFVKFYTTKRVGGDVVNYEAIKLLNLV